MSKIIECQNVCHHYNNANNKILTNFNLTINKGETIAILGKSGSGKSTLLNLLAGLDNVKSGKIIINNSQIHTMSETNRSLFRRINLGFIYQFHHLLPDFNALENIAMPLLINGSNAKYAYKSAQELLVKLKLSHIKHHKPHQLSGGERQRIAVARAIITKPLCILADEPTGNLDEHNAQDIINILLDANKNYNTTLVIVTHDDNIAKKMIRTVCLS